MSIEGKGTEGPGGGRNEAFVRSIRSSISAARELFARGSPAAVIGVVSGSEAARAFFERQLDIMRPAFGAREAVSLHEDLPVGQALGLLLLWQRLRKRLRPGEGALVAFVFGEGTRAAPFTEAECGQKPAIRSFVSTSSANPEGKRYLSIVELALRYFAPVESYLRRSGFNGIVVKWGDEVQIPALDLRKENPLLAGADVVRFVSMRPITPEEARSKDWVGVDEHGNVTAFIPRRSIEEMAKLVSSGLIRERGGVLHGGVNLGSIALSRELLDVLLEELRGEVNDTEANRHRRPDLDPQLFTALTIAATGSAPEREAAWARALGESEAMRALDRMMPGILGRLRDALDRFEARHGRRARIVAMDFGDQYWGDLGQHRRIHDFFMSLLDPSPQGEIARALAGLGEKRDQRGNIVAGETVLGTNARVEGSVLIDARIDSGRVERSVLIGTRCRELIAKDAFDVMSSAPRMVLGPRAGAYRVASEVLVEIAGGERVATVLLPSRALLMRVHEDTDLRDKAAAYDVPILGNEMSFREAHELVAGSDPMVVEERRERMRASIDSDIAHLGSSS